MQPITPHKGREVEYRLGIGCRAARLGEFLPNCRFFILGSFLKITYLSISNSWPTVFLSHRYVLFLSKIGLGYILGELFTNLSSHPDRVIAFFKKNVCR
jgi:hypothetical protein